MRALALLVACISVYVVLGFAACDAAFDQELRDGSAAPPPRGVTR